MQIHRLFEIIHLLLNRDSLTASELAQRFEVSSRTVYRDIETLSQAGIPVYMNKGRGGGIRLMSGFVLDKTLLTSDEKTELMSALHALGAVRPDEAKKALGKLGAFFGDQKKSWLEVDFSNWYNQEETNLIFERVKKAILQSRPVEFTYYGGSGGQTQRTAEPLRLVFRGQAWYMFAYCRLRAETRFFKLTRIHGLRVLDETFERVHSEPVLTATNYLSDELVSLKLKIGREASFRVYDEFERENITVAEDGSFIVDLSFPKEGGWLFSYILSFGENAEVLEPLSVRNEVTELLRKMYAKYL